MAYIYVILPAQQAYNNLTEFDWLRKLQISIDTSILEFSEEEFGNYFLCVGY